MLITSAAKISRRSALFCMSGGGVAANVKLNSRIPKRDSQDTRPPASGRMWLYLVSPKPSYFYVLILTRIQPHMTSLRNLQERRAMGFVGMHNTRTFSNNIAPTWRTPPLLPANVEAIGKKSVLCYSESFINPQLRMDPYCDSKYIPQVSRVGLDGNLVRARLSWATLPGRAFRPWNSILERHHGPCQARTPCLLEARAAVASENLSALPELMIRAGGSVFCWAAKRALPSYYLRNWPKAQAAAAGFLPAENLI